MNLYGLLLIQAVLGLYQDQTDKLSHAVNEKLILEAQRCRSACDTDKDYLTDVIKSQRCAHACDDNFAEELASELSKVGIKPDNQAIFDRKNAHNLRELDYCHKDCHGKKNQSADIDATRRCALGCDSKFADELEYINKVYLNKVPTKNELFIKEDTKLQNENRECIENCYKSKVQGNEQAVASCSTACSTNHGKLREALIEKHNGSNNGQSARNGNFRQEQNEIFTKNHSCETNCHANNKGDGAKILDCVLNCKKTIESEEKNLYLKYPEEDKTGRFVKNSNNLLGNNSSSSKSGSGNPGPNSESLDSVPKNHEVNNGSNNFKGDNVGPKMNDINTGNATKNENGKPASDSQVVRSYAFVTMAISVAASFL